MSVSLRIIIVAALLLLAAGPAVARGATADEILSIALCHQAIGIAQQHGEHTNLICEIDYIRPLQYWQCLVKTMKQGVPFKEANKRCW